MFPEAKQWAKLDCSLEQSDAYNIHKSMNKCHESYKQHGSNGISISDKHFILLNVAKREKYTVKQSYFHFIFDFFLNIESVLRCE